jgi:predicted small secreted protein
MKLITLLGTMLLLAACNTMHGLGTDIRHLGTNLEGAAKYHARAAELSGAAA